MHRYHELLKEILAAWGDTSQVLLSIEEMSELTKALLKNINRGKDNRDDIASELADTLITLEQVRMIYGITEDEIHALLAIKTEKVRRRLEKWKIKNEH